MKRSAQRTSTAAAPGFSRCNALTWVAIAVVCILASTYWLVHNHIIDGDVSLSRADESMNVAKLLRNTQMYTESLSHGGSIEAHGHPSRDHKGNSNLRLSYNTVISIVMTCCGAQWSLQWNPTLALMSMILTQ